MELTDQMREAVHAITTEVAGEAFSAMIRHDPMNSAHEGYAVILEELDELWDEVKKNPRQRDRIAMREEAIQVAAMAVRFIHDLFDDKTR